MKAVKLLAVSLLLQGAGCVPAAMPLGMREELPQPPQDSVMCSTTTAITDSAPKAVVVLIPGLNQAPKSFNALAEFLHSNGYATCAMSLSGQKEEQPDAEWHIASLGQWRTDVRAAVARAQAQFPHAPVYLLGYSIGAPLAADFALSDDSQIATKLILIAPAFALSWKASMVKPITLFRRFGVTLPSYIPDDYRARDRTSLYSYRAAFDTVDAIQAVSPQSRLGTIPGLFIGCSQDGIIDFAESTAWKDSHGGPHWQVLELCPEGTGVQVSSHLMIDGASLGAANWSRMQETLLNFLTQP